MDGFITRTEAINAGLSTYFTGKPCVNGHVAKRYVQNWTCISCHAAKCLTYQQKWRAKNPDKVKQYSEKYAESHAASTKEWRNANRDKCADNQRKWNSQNREKRNDLSRKWRAQNRDVMVSLKAKRRADILSRTPKWLTKDDLWMIREAYTLAKLRTRLTGIAWQVDHVIPLRGKKVSGLHVPSNLQVIPEHVNLKKGNRYAVD
jgi:ABC-type nitrate/sulfonate/bicarbonate transport system substrate-binding protein